MKPPGARSYWRHGKDLLSTWCWTLQMEARSELLLQKMIVTSQMKIPHRCSIKVLRCVTLYGGAECVRRVGDTTLTWVAWGLCEWALLVSCRGDTRRPEHTGNTSSWRETLCSGGAAPHRATLRDGTGGHIETHTGHSEWIRWVRQARHIFQLGTKDVIKYYVSENLLLSELLENIGYHNHDYFN